MPSPACINPSLTAVKVVLPSAIWPPAISFHLMAPLVSFSMFRNTSGIATRFWYSCAGVQLPKTRSAAKAVPAGSSAIAEAAATRDMRRLNAIEIPPWVALLLLAVICGQ